MAGMGSRGRGGRCRGGGEGGGGRVPGEGSAQGPRSLGPGSDEQLGQQPLTSEIHGSLAGHPPGPEPSRSINERVNQSSGSLTSGETSVSFTPKSHG